MLAMPYAIKQDGIVLGLFVIALSAVSSSLGLYLQGKCSKYVVNGEASFFALAQLTYPQLSVVFDAAIAIKCFGVGVSYLVVVGDLMPKIAQSLVSESVLYRHEWLLERNFYITVSMCAIIVPLCFLKQLDSLKYASMVALSSVLYLVVLVVVHFCKDDIVDKGPVRVLKPYSATSVLSSFPIFVFAYTCHQNMFSLVNELQDRSGSAINRVILISIGTAMSLYITVGLTGYLSFGDAVQPNVIVGYAHSVSSTVGRVAIVVLVMLSFPLQCHPARASINHMYHYFHKLVNRTEEPARSEDAALLDANSDVLDQQIEEGFAASSAPAASLHGTKFVVITSLILLGSYAVAISVQSLARVLAFVGSTGSTSISFILPGIFGYQLIGSEFRSVSEMPHKTRATKFAGFALAAWGLLVMVICLSATIFLGATH